MSETDVSAFESWCQVKLPTSYRDYLVHIGPGVGPYCGLWSPTEIRSELQGLLADWDAEKGPPPSIKGIFPFSLTDAERIQARKASGEKEPWIISTWPVDGCIPVCHQGCTYYSVLVLTGEHAGRIWNVANDVGSDGDWLPSWRPTGCLLKKEQQHVLPPLPLLPTFEEWFMGWVERAETDLGSSE